MIVEIFFKITENQLLAAAWEFPDDLWNNKESLIKKFIFNIFNTQNIEYIEYKWQQNIIFEIKGKPFQFYDIQNGFNDYFKSIGANILLE